MSVGRAISLEDLQQVYSRDELARLIARRGTAGAAEFLSALYSDLDDAIRGLEEAAHHYVSDGTWKLTCFLASHLRMLGYNAACSVHGDGHAELRVENSSANVIWLAKAVLHADSEQDIDGIVQLLGAMSGRHTHAGFLLYIREGGAAQILERWVEILQGDERVACRSVMPIETSCVFTSHHTHSSGFPIAIRHHAVLLDHASPRNEFGPRRPPVKKHTILFLAANPGGTDQGALERETRAIQTELERSGRGGCFEFVTRWAVEPQDLLRDLRRHKPAVVHFSAPHSECASSSHTDGEHPGGIFLQGADGRPQLISIQALEETFGAAGSSVKLVILNGCFTEAQVEALLVHVDYVVGMSSAVGGDAARAFASGFYGGIGEHESIATAFKQGCAAICLEGRPVRDRPQLRVRPGFGVSPFVLAAASET